MTQLRQTRSFQRAPRVTLHGSVSATLLLENRRQFAAQLHTVSVSGGLLEIPAYLDERSKVALAFQVGAGFIQAHAEMLFPMRVSTGYMQPFRFTGFAAGARLTLEREIDLMLRDTMLTRPTSPEAKSAQLLRSGHGTGLRLPKFFLDNP